jgi:hypothetical protein
MLALSQKRLVIIIVIDILLRSVSLFVFSIFPFRHAVILSR